jgi:hypothetical protein
VSKNFFRVDKGISLAGQTADPVTDVKDGDMYYNTALQAFRGYSNGAWGSLGGGSTIARVTQASHAFTVGQLLYLNGSTYTLAIATSAAAAEVVGMVSKVIDANTFEMTTSGVVTGLTGLTAGEAYFLSASVAGGYTITEPSTLGEVSVPIGVAGSTTTMYVAPKRGLVVGSTNSRTVVALANNAVTNVQSVSAYDAGEISGWVYIDAGTDYRFYVSAPFAKNGAGSDYNISPVYVGDTPPVGFTITITTGGLIQATLPSIVSFVSASINFALNAPAVGATFPLNIDSTLVNFSILKAKDSSGFIFQENDGTQIGSISDTGVFVLGPSNNSLTHTLNGSNVNIQTSSSAAASLNLRSTGGNSAVSFSNLSNGTPNRFNINYLQSSDTFTIANANGVSTLASVTQVGAWTIGPNSGSNITHTIQGGTDTNLTLSSQSASNVSLNFTVAGTNFFQIITGTTATNTLFRTNGNTVVAATITPAGAWTLGPSGFVGTHVINGNIQIGTSGVNRGRVNYLTTAGTNRIFISQEISSVITYGIGTDSSNNLVLGGISSGVDTWSVKPITINTSGIANFASVPTIVDSTYVGVGMRYIDVAYNPGTPPVSTVEVNFALGFPNTKVTSIVPIGIPSNNSATVDYMWTGDWSSIQTLNEIRVGWRAGNTVHSGVFTFRVYYIN